MQINFRRKVLSQTYPNLSVFRFSQNGKQFSVDQLQENLYKLLPAGQDAGDKETGSADPLLDQALQEPECLVGQRINHRFEVEGELLWYKGTVKNYDSKTQEFLVIYDGEDNPCSFSVAG